MIKPEYLVILLGLSSSVGFAKDWPFQKKSSCATQIQKALREWESTDSWNTVTSQNASDQIFETPTKTPGAWIQLQDSTDNTIHALRITAHTQMGVSWTAPQCTPQMRISTNNFFASEASDDFTDKKLKELLSKHPQGAIVLWSPNMPYSIKSLDTAREAAEAKHIPLTFVLDSNSNTKEAQKAAERLHIKVSEIQRNRSVDLIFRKAENHFPTMLLYRNGQIIETTMPGYALSSLYEKFIQEHLK